MSTVQASKATMPEKGVAAIGLILSTDILSILDFSVRESRTNLSMMNSI